MPIAAAIAPAVVSGTLLVCTAVVLVLWCMSQPKRPPPVGPAISSVGKIRHLLILLYLSKPSLSIMGIY